MTLYKGLIGKNIEIEISGGNFYSGILVDSGLDILVLYVGRSHRFYYIPTVHIQRVKEAKLDPNSVLYELPEEKPLEQDSSSISFRGILTNAKGRFVEVYVTGNKSIHGYLTSIMNNHFVFYSPIYKTVFYEKCPPIRIRSTSSLFAASYFAIPVSVMAVDVTCPFRLEMGLFKSITSRYAEKNPMVYSRIRI